MAVDRFTRFKILRALWARARTLMARLAGPQAYEARHRAFRWQQIQVIERQTRDGIVRATGDPDSAPRPQPVGQPDAQQQALHEARRRFEDAHRHWVEHHYRNGQQSRRR
jgi:hypothetical protein